MCKLCLKILCSGIRRRIYNVIGFRGSGTLLNILSMLIYILPHPIQNVALGLIESLFETPYISFK